MATAKIDGKGRVSIPASLRRRVGLSEGDEVRIVREGATLVIEVSPPKIRTVDSRGGWKKHPIITAEETFGGP